MKTAYTPVKRFVRYHLSQLIIHKVRVRTSLGVRRHILGDSSPIFNAHIWTNNGIQHAISIRCAIK